MNEWMYCILSVLKLTLLLQWNRSFYWETNDVCTMYWSVVCNEVLYTVVSDLCDVDRFLYCMYVYMSVYRCLFLWKLIGIWIKIKIKNRCIKIDPYWQVKQCIYNTQWDNALYKSLYKLVAQYIKKIFHNLLVWCNN